MLINSVPKGILGDLSTQSFSVLFFNSRIALIYNNVPNLHGVVLKVKVIFVSSNLSKNFWVRLVGSPTLRTTAGLCTMSMKIHAQVSISSTSYARLFLMKVFCAAFL